VAERATSKDPRCFFCSAGPAQTLVLRSNDGDDNCVNVAGKDSRDTFWF